MVYLPMSHYHHLIHLNDLFIEEGHILKIALLTDLGHSLEELRVVSLWQVDPWEQVRYDALEQWDVMSQELG